MKSIVVSVLRNWILGLGIIILGSLWSCSEPPASKPIKKQTYEPKFRKDGEGFLISGSDTLKFLDIEFAKTSEQIQYGMMYRKSMDSNTGMLFFMPRQETQSFYMRNTYVSLDIVFLDRDGRVVSIQKNAQTLSDKSLPSEGPAKYVFEIKGGVSDLIGLKKGDQLIWSSL